MRALLQRVTNASVTVKNEKIASIDTGLLVFLGVDKEDTTDTVDRLVKKLLAYRLFADHNGKMNRSVKDIQGGILVVSQFTLAADTNKGLRPSFSCAAAPEYAETLYKQFVEQLKTLHEPVATGEFAADMQVALINDGPVTFLLEL